MKVRRPRRVLAAGCVLAAAGAAALVVGLVHRGRGFAPVDLGILAPGSAEALARQTAAAREYGLPVEIKNSLGMRFRLIPPGAFAMGSPAGEAGQYGDETQHRVTLTKPFYLGATEVTQGQWEKFAHESGYLTEAEKEGSAWVYDGSSWGEKKGASWQEPGCSAGRRDPVTCVSWNDAQALCEWLSKKEGVTYRLPTEAEWEYACRAGTSTAFYSGACTQPGGADPNLDRIGWYRENSGYPAWFMRASAWLEKNIKHGMVKGDGMRPRSVGGKAPNAWGLYDMSGNVWEWCLDWYDDYSGDAVDPTGPGTGSLRVFRGGGWRHVARYCRSAYRDYGAPGLRYDFLGVRLLRMP